MKRRRRGCAERNELGSAIVPSSKQRAAEVVEDRGKSLFIMEEILGAGRNQAGINSVEEGNRPMIRCVARSIDQAIWLIWVGPDSSSPALRNQVGAVANTAVGIRCKTLESRATAEINESHWSRCGNPAEAA